MALDPASMAALQAFTKGQSPTAASNNVNETKAATKGLEKSGSPFAPKAVTPEGESVEVESGKSPFDTPDPLKQFLGGNEEEAEEPSEAASQEAEGEEQEDKEASSSEESKETVWVKGVNGKRQKVTIDYSNKDAIKKAFVGQAGMQRFREERDAAINELKSYKGSVSEDLQVSQTLQQAYEKSGIDGLISVVAGDEGINKYVEQKMQERRIWEEATPAERRALEAQREAEKKGREKSDLEARLGELENRLKSKDVEYEQKNIEGLMHSAYAKHSFDGMFDNEQDVEDANDTLWLRVSRRLEEVPEDEPLTKAAVDAAFKEESARLRRMLVKQGKKQAHKIVEKQKKKAAESIQNRAKSGMSTQGQADKAKAEFGKLLKSGNLVAAMTTWTKNGGFKR